MTYPELESLRIMVEEHLAEVAPMSKIKLEEHLAPQRNVSPEIVPSRQASVDRITEFLMITNEGTSAFQCMVKVAILLARGRASIGAVTHTLFRATIVLTSFIAVS